MLDRAAQKILQPVLQANSRVLLRLGLGADVITALGFALGMAAAVAIAHQSWAWGLGLLLASRWLDFLFYAAIPLALAVADPVANALPAAVLLASFVGTGSSFLAFAVLAEKRQLSDTAMPGKSFYFLGGLTEATETLAVFVAMC